MSLRIVVFSVTNFLKSLIISYSGGLFTVPLATPPTLPLAQAFNVETEGTKKYSPPLEVTKNGFGSPGAGTAP